MALSRSGGYKAGAVPGPPPQVQGLSQGLRHACIYGTLLGRRAVKYHVAVQKKVRSQLWELEGRSEYKGCF